MNDKLFQKLKQSYSYIGLAESVLRAHADALAGLGLVNDENIDEVISKQKAYLEGLQKYNDSRVNDALAKAAEKSLKDAEDKAKKAAEEAARKAREEAEKSLPDSVKSFLDGLKADRQKEIQEAEAARVKAAEEQKAREAQWTESLKKMQDEIAGFRKENDDLKKAAAARQRQESIVNKAKELGIPQYRIDEGFVIADDATEEGITSTLTAIAQNIKAHTLPGSHAGKLTDDKVTKEEVDSIADAMVKNL